MTTDFSLHSKTLSRPILWCGFILGLVLGMMAMSGDEEGRVNLLYVLLVYLFLPVMGCLLSLLSLFTSKGLNFARLVNVLPIWSQQYQHFVSKANQNHIDKPWYFMQSQAAAISYSAASLLVMLLMLLVTDINFVWRSTLLTAEDLYPFLKGIAIPWWFWEFAQPKLTLLQQTQDSRLLSTGSPNIDYGQWWGFVVAVQLVYSFLLRSVLLISTRYWMINTLQSKITPQKHDISKEIRQSSSLVSNSTEVSSQLPSEYAIINWANFDEKLVYQLNLSPTKIMAVSRTHFEDALKTAEQLTGQHIVIVKSWEPPLGELKDFLEMKIGLLFPINTNNAKAIKPTSAHLNEWRRFVADMENWQIYQPKEWVRDDG